MPKNLLKLQFKKRKAKTGEATHNLLGNKIPDKITKVSKSSPRLDLETVTK